MAIQDPTPPPGLLIDELTSRLDSLNLLRERDESQVNAALEAFGSQGLVEDQMITELSGRQPIQHPDKFDEAHRNAMRALEVFDRNGPKPPSALKLPSLVRPAAERVIQLLITAIVRNHQKRLVKDLRQLYAMREANSVVGSDHHQMLATARIQVDTITADLNKSSLPLPAFLVGGAAVSSLISLTRNSLTLSDTTRYLFSAAFLVLGLAAVWCVLKAAGIARRRTRIALDASFLALWQVLGDAGSPPRDHAKIFATVATLLMIAVWIVVPAVVSWSIIDN